MAPPGMSLRPAKAPAALLRPLPLQQRTLSALHHHLQDTGGLARSLLHFQHGTPAQPLAGTSKVKMWRPCPTATTVHLQHAAHLPPSMPLQDFKGMMKDLLREFYKACGKKKPERIIVYRDGVSEGQFDAVQQQELPQVGGRGGRGGGGVGH